MTRGSALNIQVVVLIYVEGKVLKISEKCFTPENCFKLCCIWKKAKNKEAKKCGLSDAG